ncbi:MAG: silent information regulator protein Sir2 [Candidatus Hydrogenedentota bacterium]
MSRHWSVTVLGAAICLGIAGAVSAEDSPSVEGWAFEQDRVEERLGRGLIAMPREQGDVYLRWRLLEEDEGAAFDVYRAADGGDPERLNEEPITDTTDFVDDTADLSVGNEYFVEARGGAREGERSEGYRVDADPDIRPYRSIALQDEDTTFQKVGIGDLNGDGRYDFVIKTPNTNVDPWREPGYWEPSETTYKLEAYLSDGTFLWSKDLGWNIEAGIWYSPYIVHDFNGDGQAEVVLKSAPTDEDFRDTEPGEDGYYEAGRVRGGPEWLSVLDGMTGEELARTDWPSREGFQDYNRYSRNQIGVAYLDGKTPCLLAQRGTYGIMKLQAFQLKDGELEQLWAWESTDEPDYRYEGQGAHNLHTVDVDDDGRDEIILGACAIDDTGEGLWSLEMGHPDNLFVGDLDPARPGLEVFFGMETGQERNGICMGDAATGELLWGLDQSTNHIHSSGLASNIDTSNPGAETYAGEQSTDERWLYTAQGELLAREDDIPWSTLAPAAVYWDETTQREMLVGGRIFRYPEDETLFEDVQGSQAAWVDLVGDWREEIITSAPGELRIYSTDVPAGDRRVTLMQDHLYRTSVAHMAMGYGDNPPLTSYFIGDH